MFQCISFKPKTHAGPKEATEYFYPTDRSVFVLFFWMCVFVVWYFGKRELRMMTGHLRMFWTVWICLLWRNKTVLLVCKISCFYTRGQFRKSTLPRLPCRLDTQYNICVLLCFKEYLIKTSVFFRVCFSLSIMSFVKREKPSPQQWDYNKMQKNKMKGEAVHQNNSLGNNATFHFVNDRCIGNIITT